MSRAAILAAALALLLASSVLAQGAKLTASDASANAFFGQAVALRGDLAVVGAPGTDDGAGAAYVFFRDPSLGWTQQARLPTGMLKPGDAFGFAVAIDAPFIIVGAPGDDERAPDAGAAYIFLRTGTTWALQHKLTASDPAVDARFGYAVAVSGIAALAGAPGTDGAGFGKGAAYAFAFDGSGWRLQDTLSAPDADARDAFGLALDLGGDTALIGAARADEPRGRDAGLAYVFIRTGTAWFSRAVLTAGDAAPDNHFGTAVALSTDPMFVTPVALIGAPHAGLTDIGRAYLFANRDTLWAQTQDLLPGGFAPNDRTGMAVALSGDYALVTGPIGTVTLFSNDRLNGWTQQATLTAPTATPGTRFGQAVALDGVHAFVGAPADAEGGLEAGAVYAYNRTMLNTAREEPPPLQSARLASASYPNPFRHTATIAFEVPAEAARRVSVRLIVYDARGRSVARLIDEALEPGRHEAAWTAAGLPSGVYLYRLQIGRQTHTRALVRLR